MADIGTKISELEAAAALDGTELLVAVQGGQTKKSTAAAVETLVKTGLTASDVGLGNVANERQYSAQNPPPTPTPAEIGAVPTSRTINGKALSADITLAASDVGAEEELTWDNVPTAGSTNPVKSGGIYDAILALLPTDTASGSIASFPDGADDVPVKDLSVNISPVQDLHGYDNPWPAGGGKNKLGVTITRLKTINNGGTWNGNTYTHNGATFVCTETSDGYLETVTVSASNASANISFGFMQKPDVVRLLSALENTAIIGSGCPADGSSGTYSLNFQGFATDGIGASDTGSGTGIINAGSFTSFNTVQIYIRVASGATFSNKVFEPQLCLASATDPLVFAPYSNICPISGRTGMTLYHSGADTSDPETVSVSWQSEAGTVYGGTLDVTTGVLTVTNGYIASYAGETLPGAWISDRDVYAEGTSPSTGAQVVYALAAPVTYQLTPTQVRTLYGENNIWADCGPVEAEYRADLEKYIEKKIGEEKAES